MLLLVESRQLNRSFELYKPLIVDPKALHAAEVRPPLALFSCMMEHWTRTICMRAIKKAG